MRLLGGLNEIRQVTGRHSAWLVFRKRRGERGVFFFKTVFYFSVTVKSILLSPDGNIVIFQFVIF